MPYDPVLVQPMRDDLTRLGFEELFSAADVDRAVTETKGTLLVAVNSVCGCAAGKARPGIALSMESDVKPDRMITVFAGQDLEATAQARTYFAGYMPSSPQVALLKDGQVVYMMERHDIEGNDALTIANKLIAAYHEHCKGGKVSAS